MLKPFWLLAFMLLTASLTTACDVLGEYTVVNESAEPVLASPAFSRCDEAGETAQRVNSWQIVDAHSQFRARVAGFGHTCIVLADIRRQIIAVEPYSKGRVFTVHADHSYTATAFTGSESLYLSQAFLITWAVILGPGFLVASYITLRFFYGYYVSKSVV